MVLVQRYLARGAALTAIAVCTLCAAVPRPALAQYGAGLTIRDISPVQLYPVASVSVPPPVALPPLDDGDAGQGLSAPVPATTVSSGVPVSNPLLLDYVPMSLVPAAAANDAWPSRGRATSARAQAWLAAPSDAGQMELGARNWHFTSSSGVGITVGNALSSSPLWGQPVRLAGVGVHGAPAGGWQGGAWQYATSVGALDDSGDDTISSGGLAYGPTASDTFIKYDATSSLSLTSQVQWAPDLLTVGVGGQYGLGSLGSWVLGVSRAQQPMGAGWRYQLGYQVDVLNDWNVSWTNTQRGSGYASLYNYTEGSAAESSVGNQWAVTVPMGRWGSLSGIYEQTTTAQGPTSSTLGLAQQFWYGPDLQVRLEANHNILTDDYGMGLNLSFPLN